MPKRKLYRYSNRACWVVSTTEICVINPGGVPELGQIVGSFQHQNTSGNDHHTCLSACFLRMSTFEWPLMYVQHAQSIGFEFYDGHSSVLYLHILVCDVFMLMRFILFPYESHPVWVLFYMTI